MTSSNRNLQTCLSKNSDWLQEDIQFPDSVLERTGENDKETSKTGRPLKVVFESSAKTKREKLRFSIEELVITTEQGNGMQQKLLMAYKRHLQVTSELQASPTRYM
jgi:hypothetical protein